jgi:tRNA threonylcarbamoyladenosine biosynthesis protein TsaB
MTTIAGLDAATDDVTVAVTTDSEPVTERFVPKPEGGRPRHAEVLMTELEAAVAEAGGWERVDVLAAGVGPGSFTGLRVGLATARAIAQALSVQIVPVGTLAALAEGIAETGDGSGRRRLAVLDARRGQVFAALFDPDGGEVWEPFVSGPEELAERLRTAPERPLAAGSGALRFRRELEAAGAEVLPDSDSAHRVRARHVCRLAEGGAPSPPEGVQPIYLRPPDAELWLDRDTS